MKILFQPALMALISGVVLLLSISAERTGTDDYAETLRRARDLDARLGQQILEGRFGRQTSYDAIVATSAELRATVVLLREPPLDVGPFGHAEIAGEIGALERTLEAKLLRIEDWKSDNSVLRNSLRFFPIAASELALRLQNVPRSQLLAARINDLLGIVLLFNVTPDPESLPRVERAIVAAREAASSSPEDAEELALLLAHAKVMVERKPRVDLETQQILEMPTRDLLEAADRAYVTHSERVSVVSALALALCALAGVSLIFRLRRAAAQERQLGEQKSKFFLMASHEVRKPLAVVLSSTDLLDAYGGKWSGEKKDEHYARIRTAVAEMTSMLDELLVLGRAGMGMLEARREPIDLAVSVEKQLAIAREQSGGRHAIEGRLAGEATAIHLDEKLLNAILSNLLSNAVKYSPQGGAIQLFVEVSAGTVLLRVEDHGIGVPAADQARLFEAFQRGGNVGKIHGIGLGLAVVKAAAEAHGGSVHLASREGVGTIFTVRLHKTREAR